LIFFFGAGALPTGGVVVGVGAVVGSVVSSIIIIALSLIVGGER
jgi:hypothetical protein